MPIANGQKLAISMTVTSAEKTVIEMRKTFAIYGLPCQIVLENRAQFTYRVSKAKWY